jgi:error-prone DNA polymerase
MKGNGSMDKQGLDLFLTESEAMQHCTATHILAPFREDLQKHNFTRSTALKWKPHGGRLKTAGRVIIIHTPPTKSGKRVMFLTLEDEEGLLDLTVFEDVRTRYAKKILASTVLLVEGITNRFGLRGVSIVARHFWTLREFYERIENDGKKEKNGFSNGQDPDKKRHLLPEPSAYRGRPG